jgi:phosphopantetheinyl transferase (holo-ACP synthase)
MNPPAFTTNPKRIARLEYNYNAGVKRETIPAEEREQMDKKLLNVTPAYLSQLFANVEAIRKAKKEAPAEAELVSA